MSSEFFGGSIKEGGVEIPVEHFDFSYVENKANDWRELRTMLEVLKSGKEGYYPDLMNAVEAKMLQLMPEKEKRLYIAMTTEPSHTEEQAAKSEIGNVLDNLSTFDAEIKAAKSGSIPSTIHGASTTRDVFDKVGGTKSKANLPPVRGAVTTKIKVNPNLRDETEAKEKEVKARKIDSRQGSFKEYYDMWSKFDAEKESADLDMSDIANDMARAEADELRKKEEKKRMDKHRVELDNLHLTFDLSAMSAQQRQIMARNEKDKGNECFRASELSQSIYHYSRSLHLDPSNCIVYANRALSYLKSKEYDNAERDCDRAIQLDNGYIKAYSRRGLTRHKRGKYQQAIDDFEKALELEPGNKEITKLLQESKDKYVEVEGEAADVRVVQGKKKFSRIQIEEDDDDEQDNNVTANSPIVPNSPISTTASTTKASSASAAASIDTINVAAPSKFKRVAIQEEENDEEEKQDDANDTTITMDPVPSTQPSDAVVAAVTDTLPTPTADELIVAASKAAEEALRVNSNPEGAASAVKNHGAALLNAGRYQEALDCFSHSLRLFPRQTAGYLNRAEAYIKLGKFADAEKDCTICLAINGSNCNEDTKAATYLRRGVVRKYLNKLSEAREDLHKALEFGFSVEEVKREIAVIDSLEGVSAISTPIISKETATAKVPATTKEVPTTKAKVDDAIPKSVVKAAEVAPKSVEADSKSTAVLSTCGTCKGRGVGLVTNSNGMCNHCNRPVPAENKATSVPVLPDIVNDPRSAEELKVAGNEEFKAGKFDAALQLYSAAVMKDPFMDTARLNKAAALLKMEKFSEAEAECSVVIKRNKRDVKALYRRGVALRGLGKYALSILDFEEVILHEPNNNKAREEVRETKLLKEKADAVLSEKINAATAAERAPVIPAPAATSTEVADGSLPSLGEAATKSLEMQNKALATAERVKAKLLVKLPASAPKTGAEFKRELYNLRKQPETFALYLHMLPIDKIQSFFMKGGFDADILELSVTSIRHHMTMEADKDLIASLLMEYSKVKAFKTACMVLDNKCTTELLEIISSLSDHGVADDQVAALKKAYNL